MSAVVDPILNWVHHYLYTVKMEVSSLTNIELQLLAKNTHIANNFTSSMEERLLTDLEGTQYHIEY